MTLLPNESALDTLTLSGVNNTLKIKNWLSYSYHQDFMNPTVDWSFSVPFDDLTTENLIPGLDVSIYINSNIQCTGLIEKITTNIDPNSGSIIHVQGRDLMAKVVEGNINPALHWAVNCTLKKVIEDALAPLSITKINYSGDNSNSGGNALNKNAITGKQFIPDEDTEFSKKELKLLKTNYNEGTYQFIDKLLKRNGYMMWAAADGSGVVISQPNFTQDPIYTINHTKIQEGKDPNNVLFGEKVFDITGQPTLLYCKGFNNADGDQIVGSDIIMINELIALDKEGVVFQNVQNIIDTYKKKGTRVLPLRIDKGLIDYKNSYNHVPINIGPCFIKDDETTDSIQLENFVRRTMAGFQVKVGTLHYRVLGHTQNNIPWAINTMVTVKDETLNIDGNYWIKSRTFTKTPSGGTYTDLILIRPWTLDISSFGNGTKPKVQISPSQKVK